MSDDNVKAFPGAVEMPENPLKIAQRPLHFCNHDAVILDEHSRSVHCADVKCGAVLDAFDYLVKNGRSIQRAWSAYAEAQRKAGELVDRVAALKKEEARLRAMVKRLQDKTGAVLNVRSREP